MTEGSDKRVDESWKEQAERERREPRSERPQPEEPPPPQAPGREKAKQPRRGEPGTDFGLFLSSLSMQAMVALGEMAHPTTGLPQEELEQARYLIDVLGLLREKTQGNLTQEEVSLLEGVLYELRMKYVSKTQGSRR